MPGQRLVALDHAALDRIVVGSVVHEIPGAVGDLARGLGRRALPQAIDERDLEALDLVGGIARRHARERLGDRLLPHRGGDQQSVAQRDLIDRRHQRQPNGCLPARLLSAARAVAA